MTDVSFCLVDETIGSPNDDPLNLLMEAAMSENLLESKGWAVFANDGPAVECSMRVVDQLGRTDGKSAKVFESESTTGKKSVYVIGLLKKDRTIPVSTNALEQVSSIKSYSIQMASVDADDAYTGKITIFNESPFVLGSYSIKTVVFQFFDTESATKYLYQNNTIYVFEKAEKFSIYLSLLTMMNQGKTMQIVYEYPVAGEMVKPVLFLRS